jgi:hypothetical protein
MSLNDVNSMARLLLEHNEVLIDPSVYRTWWVGWCFHESTCSVTISGHNDYGVFDNRYSQDVLKIYIGKRMKAKTGNIRLLLAADALCWMLEEIGVCYELGIDKNMTSKKTGVRLMVRSWRGFTDSELGFLRARVYDRD